jgi:hypothetical protein
MQSMRHLSPAHGLHSAHDKRASSWRFNLLPLAPRNRHTVEEEYGAYVIGVAKGDCDVVPFVFVVEPVHVFERWTS